MVRIVRKGSVGHLNQYRPRPAAASLTRRLIRVCTVYNGRGQMHIDSDGCKTVLSLITCRVSNAADNLGQHFLQCPSDPGQMMKYIIIVIIIIITITIILSIIIIIIILISSNIIIIISITLKTESQCTCMGQILLPSTSSLGVTIYS